MKKTRLVVAVCLLVIAVSLLNGIIAFQNFALLNQIVNPDPIHMTFDRNGDIVPVRENSN